jgi:transcriptional regulator with XRE-family HTH domain
VIILENFCDRLRLRRKELGLTGPYVAEQIGVSRNYIYEIEKARKAPSLETVMKLADVYHKPAIIDDFMQISAKMNVDGNFNEAVSLASFRIRADKIFKENKEAYREALAFFKYFLDKYDKPTE